MLCLSTHAWARPPSSSAAPTTAPVTRQLSPYEVDITKRVLRERKLELVTQAEGMLIDGVEVETLDVFEPEDPLPKWVNWFHATSRKEVISREVLLRQGQRYSQAVADESARNLRNLKQLSLVLILPVKSSKPGLLRLLVITKDVWSRRLNSAYRLKNGSLEYLLLTPSEENLFGQHIRIAGHYAYDLTTNTYGGTLAHQRLFGSRIAFLANAYAIQHRPSGQFEGTIGRFSFGQPIYSTRAEWAWGTSLAWSNRMHRSLLPNAEGGYSPRLFDDPETKEPDKIPYRYRSREIAWQTYVTRSYGVETKSNFSFGLEAEERKFDANNLRREGYRSSAVSAFERRVLERSNMRIGPFAMLESYQNRFVSLYDVETLGLQEDYRLGARSFIKVYTGAKRANATRDLIGVSAGVDYTATQQGSLARIWAIHTSEISPNRKDSDGLIQGGIRLVSPSLGLGRLVYDAGAVYRYIDYRNARYALGGESRLRGYPTEQFLGKNVVTSNLEFRTRSVKFFEVLFGLIGFYDLGDAFDSEKLFAPKQSIGFGARATAPQLQRIAARLDVAFPMTKPQSRLNEQWGGVDVLFSLDGQAFPYPTTKPSAQRSPLLATE